MTLRHPLAEHRLLYIVHACAMKGVMFKSTKPLRLCPKGSDHAK